MSEDANIQRAQPQTGLTRRDLLISAGAIFVCSFRVPVAYAAEIARRGEFEPNAFIRIDTVGLVTLTIPQVEMGQGTYTSLAMLLAEELDADWNRVRVEHAPADERHYVNPMLSIQGTGNSNSVRAFWLPLRRAGASTRARLVAAAANVWRVPSSECRTVDSKVVHDPTGRELEYVVLAEQAASLTAPKDIPLKDPAAFRLIGRPLKRLDSADKVNGQVKYAIDVLPAGVSIATLVKSPVLGGTINEVDDRRARAIDGVQQVVVLNDLVAVVGKHMWAVKRGLEALQISWNDGANAEVSSELMWRRLRNASKRDGAVAKDVGDIEKFFAGHDAAEETLSAEYEMPLLAHACMEPLNCTAHVTPTSAEVWIGTQVMQRVREAVARAANLPATSVTVHNHFLGGGFGRRLEPDMAYDAARIAKHVKGPVKVVWSREEDIRHDIYRPAYHSSISARLVAGRIVAWKHKVSGSSVIARFLPDFFRNGVDPDGVDSAHDIPYDIPNYRVEFNREEPPGVITGFWRGVGPNNAVFAIESCIDELARKERKDPIDFRRAHLEKSPRLRAALDLVRKESGWDSPLSLRNGRGIAVQTSFGSFIATVVECEVDHSGAVRLQRVTVAVDTGIVINPDTVVAQVQGGLVFGLTAALYGEITLLAGRVQQSNFHDYPMLRINDVPPIDVHLIKSAEPPGGIGEAGTTAAVPALRNAIYAATGVALRRMPVERALLSTSARA
jgi:isoquinoline 1-oxidoreductase subunit beta